LTEDSTFPTQIKSSPKNKDDKGKKGAGNPHRDRIFGQHVQIYMEHIKKDEKRYTKQFSKWDGCLKTSKLTKLEDLYKKVHAEIRKNPDRVRAKPLKKKGEKQKMEWSDANRSIVKGAKPYRRDRKLTNKQRKERVAEKIKKYAAERQRAK